MTRSATKKVGMRLPRAIRREVVEALNAVEVTAIANEREPDATRLLEDYRSNRAQGLLNPSYIRATPAFLISAVAQLDRAFNSIHTFDPEDYISRATAIHFGKQGGLKPTHDKEQIKAWIRELIQGHTGGKKQKQTDIIKEVQSRCEKCHRQIPQKTFLNKLISEVMREKKIR